MMTIAFALLALAILLLWRRVQWSWALVLAALILGIVIFAQDVDFSTKLGIQL
jgi:hypothetical protein